MTASDDHAAKPNETSDASAGGDTSAPKALKPGAKPKKKTAKKRTTKKVAKTTAKPADSAPAAKPAAKTTKKAPAKRTTKVSAAQVEPEAEAPEADTGSESDAKPRKTRTRKKVAKKTTAKAKAEEDARAEAEADAAETDARDASTDESDADADADSSSRDDRDADTEGGKKRTRRKRGGRGRSKKSGTDANDDEGGRTTPQPSSKPASQPSSSRAQHEDDEDEDEQPSARARGERKPHTRMLISYQPGEECRVAVTEDGKLEEFDAESFAQLSRVGNIYLGTVTNVEPGIQAAFVDFGVEDAGFLHVSDLHPMYFPGNDEDDTERVGKKTPRRERPPIQQALKRGQQVIVQVIKEGIGTKGPTVTSYLSIPGRFLVMMPNMDKVGVSRKVEDEDQRRKMRQILDQLDLPDGFGFILRTAGMDRTKTEIKRDLAYLQRLWKAIENARSSGKGKKRLLYAESDLLVRSLRDQLTGDFDEVIIDHPLALDRASRFMKIVAPRSSVKLTQYTGRSPMFHAFGVEEQIRLMHAREVPMPGGGRLVIDETEALVAIDVNSGKMRAARDAETNAYRVNLEAVDEICRQLRLRDLGGLVVNDLIDMRDPKHRRDIEQRFRDRMKRDRARSTMLPISQFGILEMTRQRMRGSQQSQHFSTCPSCSGRGLLKRPATVAAEALRDLQSVLEHDKVAKAEIVVSPRLAGTLLSERRGSLGRIERASGKQVIVRVSEATPPDRVVFYAYEANGADIDLSKVRGSKVAPKDLQEWLHEDGGEEAFASDAAADLAEQAEREKRELEAAERERALELEPHPIEQADESRSDARSDRRSESRSDSRSGQRSGPASDRDESDESGEGGKKKRRRRRRRGGRKGEGGDDSSTRGPSDSSDETNRQHADARDTGPSSDDASGVDHDQDHDGAREGSRDGSGEGSGDGFDDGAGDGTGEGGKKKRRRRRRGRRRGGEGGGEGSGEGSEGEGANAQDAGERAADRKPDRNPDRDPDREGTQPQSDRGGRRSGRDRRADEPAKTAKGESGSSNGSSSKPDKADAPSPTVKKKVMKTLYRGARRTLSASERGKIKFE